MRKMKKGRWTAEIAEAELSRWAESGLSMRAFSEKRGYPAPRLTWWRVRLSTGKTERKGSTRPKASGVGLVEAAVVGLPASPDVVVHAGTGTRIEIVAVDQVSPEWVAEVATALQRRR